MIREEQAKKEIVEVGRRLYKKGFVAANNGNITIRIGDNHILSTPTGVSKGFMEPEMIVKVDLKGNKVAGDLEPSSELKMHLGVYRHRPDTHAVLHAHPPAATAFAAVGKPLDKPVLPEVIFTLGAVPLAKYATPSTEKIPASVKRHLSNHDAVLMENHGVLTVGPYLFNALLKMEIIEHFALVSIYARILGEEQELPSREVEKLLQIRKDLGISGRHPWV